VAALTPEDQRMLSTQPLDNGEPGTVVRDFETLLVFLGDNTPTVNSKHHRLPMGSLTPLNAQMTHPMQLGLQRPQQRAYAHLHALYLWSALPRLFGPYARRGCWRATGRRRAVPRGRRLGSVRRDRVDNLHEFIDKETYGFWRCTTDLVSRDD